MHNLKIEFVFACYYIMYVNYDDLHKSPVASSAPGATVDLSPVFMLVAFPKMCNKITTPMYATENNNIVFGDIYQPSASSPKNESEFYCCLG